MMIAVPSKSNATSASSPLNLNTNDMTEGEKGSGLSFADLLRGVSDKDGIVLATDPKEIQESKLSKKDMLLSLLKGETKGTDPLPLELNPIITNELSPKDLKVLIAKAKEYLKSKITSHMHLSKSEMEALPKTLKGLASLASKIGIDISKITLEDFKANGETLKRTELKPEPKEQTVTLEDDAESIKKSKKTLSLQSTPDDEIREEQRKALGKNVEIKTIPLFKSKLTSEITTQQLVSVKLTTTNSPKELTPKQKADETLKMLLRGEKAVKKEDGFSADFSVATARVIAPTATKKPNPLESLLRGDTHENPLSQKIDALQINKADSFEVKLNEAKQMTKYLSQDVKSAIENYKSPFTRVKVELNPQRLGSVELTVVQRGKNLHINLSSNNAAINALSMNAGDLRIQLQNNGINNASLNFNNSSQNSEQSFSGGGQQHSRHEKEATKEYGFFENEEKNEELLSSLEIVVPHYV